MAQIEYFCSLRASAVSRAVSARGAPGPERLVRALEGRMCLQLFVAMPEHPCPVAHNGLLPFASAPKECGEGLKTTC